MIELKLFKWRITIIWDFDKFHAAKNPKRRRRGIKVEATVNE